MDNNGKTDDAQSSTNWRGPLPPLLTEAAAKELGRAIRAYRTTSNLTMREVTRAAPISYQYIANIEAGSALTVNEDKYRALAKGIRMPEAVMADFLLRARVYSALERRGLTPEQQAFIWKGIEQRLAEVGINLRLDLEKQFADILLSPPRRRESSVQPDARNLSTEKQTE